MIEDLFGQPEKTSDSLDAWFDSLFESISEQIQEVLEDAVDEDEVLGFASMSLPNVHVVLVNDQWHVTLIATQKSGLTQVQEKFFYACKRGEEAILVRHLMSQAEDADIDFGWLDAASVCRKLSEVMGQEQLGSEFELKDDASLDDWDEWGQQAA